MGLQTISQVSRDYGVSTRMLRYYEQAGLLQSLRKDGYAYRVYDADAVSRLRQIIVLRKLRVPVKQIISILNNNDAAETVEIFRRNISQIDGEITALSTVKSILTRFVEEINEKADVKLNLLGDDAVFYVINSLSFSDNQISERMDDVSIDDLNKANEELMKLEDKDVRIVYVPPMTVAAAYASGEDRIEIASDIVNTFIKQSGLYKMRPDARGFDFDCSASIADIGVRSYGHEAWVSVPDAMHIPAPLVKRKFKGGLYAAHVLRSWDFQDWRRLKQWADASDRYANDWDCPRWDSDEPVYCQGFEETLNLYNFVHKHNTQMSFLQLDLLLPIKEKEKGETSNEQIRKRVETDAGALRER